MPKATKTKSSHLWVAVGDAGYPYVAFDFTADSSAGGATAFVRTDKATGETYLRLPVPSSDLVTQAVSALTALLAGLKKG